MSETGDEATTDFVEVSKPNQKPAQEKNGPKASNIRDYIIEAVSLAHQAVQADIEVEPDVEKARRLYREVAQRLEHIAPFIPDEHAKVLNKFSKIYLERAHALKEGILQSNEDEGVLKEQDLPQFPQHKYTMIPMSSSSTLNPSLLLSTLPSVPVTQTSESSLALAQTGFSLPVFTVQFIEEKIPNVAQENMQPPKLPAHRPFWLMKALAQTMLEGGHLTPGLYIPRAVWFQNGAKLFGQQAKITFCTNLSTCLQKLSKADLNNTKQLIDSLDEFIERAEKEQQALNKQLPSNSNTFTTSEKKQELYNTSSNTSASKYLSSKMFGFGKSIYKSAMGLVANRTKEETTEHPYVPWLISIFEHSQFLDNWLTHFETKENGLKVVQDRLEKISFFFYFVLCHFVLQDLNILLERYMRKSRESFSRLFPKSYKF